MRGDGPGRPTHALLYSLSMSRAGRRMPPPVIRVPNPPALDAGEPYLLSPLLKEVRKPYLEEARKLLLSLPPLLSPPLLTSSPLSSSPLSSSPLSSSPYLLSFQRPERKEALPPGTSLPLPLYSTPRPSSPPRTLLPPLPATDMPFPRGTPRVLVPPSPAPSSAVHPGPRGRTRAEGGVGPDDLGPGPPCRRPAGRGVGVVGGGGGGAGCVSAGVHPSRDGGGRPVGERG